MEPSKILLFTYSLRKGGAENQLVKLAVYLKTKANYDVSIVQFEEGNDFEDLLHEKDIPASFFPSNSIHKLQDLYKMIAHKKPELIIAFMYKPSMIARIFKILFKIPIITSVRSSGISRKYHILYRLTHRIDNITAFNSTFALKKFKQKRLTSHKHSVLINNAIVIPAASLRLERSSKVFTLICLANFRAIKDHHTLFKAISLLKEKGVIIKLYALGTLYGQTEPYTELRRLGIKEEVEIVGFTHNTQKYLGMSDALVLTSLWEGTSNAILEGMANRLPIIASDVPGNTDLVKSARCGFLFKSQNVKELADVIIKMRNISQSEKEKLAANGFRYVSEFHAEHRVYGKWLEIIEGVVKHAANHPHHHME